MMEDSEQIGNKSLYILQNEMFILKNIDSYLKNRGWSVSMGSHLREALTFIIQNQPQFVMIPCDHSNEKVKIFPKLLVQAFPIDVIVYTNTTTPTSLATLMGMGVPYHIYPPISGPAIERMMLKIQKDKTMIQQSGGQDLYLKNLGSSANYDSDDLYSKMVSNQNSKPNLDQARQALNQLLQQESLNNDLKRHESIIIQGTQIALEESVLVSADQEKEILEIEKTSHLACIVIESPKFSGYLIAALGKNRSIDKQFMVLVKDRLFSFLKAHGEIIKDDDTLSIKTQEIEFNDWALEQAQFLRRSIHGNEEIAMAFFPTQETSLKLEESVSEKMLKLTLDDLKDDTPIEFDLYIYMPENNKYLLYTPQGRPIYGKQKNRLKEKGVNHMHLRKESIGSVKKYKAQNFLNARIEEYKQKIKEKRSRNTQ